MGWSVGIKIGEVEIATHIVPSDWQFIGSADVTTGSALLFTNSDFTLNINRGDSLVVGIETHTVSKALSDSINGSTITIEKEYASPSGTVAVYKIAECSTGSY